MILELAIFRELNRLDLIEFSCQRISAIEITTEWNGGKVTRAPALRKILQKIKRESYNYFAESRSVSAAAGFEESMRNTQQRLEAPRNLWNDVNFRVNLIESTVKHFDTSVAHRALK